MLTENLKLREHTGRRHCIVYMGGEWVTVSHRKLFSQGDVPSDYVKDESDMTEMREITRFPVRKQGLLWNVSINLSNNVLFQYPSVLFLGI